MERMKDMTRSGGLIHPGNRKANGKNVAYTLLITLAGLMMIVPFVWMLSAAFKRPLDVLEYPIRWIPAYWYPNNFIKVWDPKNRMALAYLNSVKVSSMITLGAVAVSSLSGYAFARIPFRHRDQIFLLYLATMMIPSQVTMIPKFIMFDGMGLLNTHYALILPGLFTAFGTFLMRQSYLQIPMELSEAAMIDGAGELRQWGQIITPLIAPTLSSLGLLVFMGNWNHYEEPLIFLTKRELMTIPLALNNFMDEHIADYGQVMAATVSALAPLILVFAFGQRFFVKGLTEGAVKG